SLSTSNFIEVGLFVYINNRHNFFISDPDLDALNNNQGDYNHAKLTISITGGNSEEILSLGGLSNIGISIDGNNLVDSNNNIVAVLDPSGSGKLIVSFASTYGDNSSIVTTDLANKILQSISYQNLSNNPYSQANINYSFDNGLGLGDNSVVSSNIMLNIIAIDNPPINTVPSIQTINENASLIFSNANHNSITITDIDANVGTETVNLSIHNGTLTLGSVNNLTNVIGNNSSNITITGTLSDINQALNGLKFSPNSNYYGTDVLTITTNDNNNTGLYGPLTTIASVNINVNQLNTAPTINNLGTTSLNTYIENGTPIAILNSNSNFNISDLQLNLLNYGLGNYHGSTFSIYRNAGANSQDIFSFSSMASAGIAVDLNNNILTVNNHT
ncbi:MAG: hypothetical protein ACR2HS_05020, partial [Gammaproteobacteria bacterium]